MANARRSAPEKQARSGSQKRGSSVAEPRGISPEVAGSTPAPASKTRKTKTAGVAQPAERRPSKSEAPGLSPVARSSKPTRNASQPPEGSPALPKAEERKAAPAMAAMDALGIECVCDLIRDGKTYKQIAGQAGCSEGSLIGWLAADLERSARAREARAQAAAVYEAAGMEAIEQASDPFELAKAKEIAQHLRWRASKVNPREYGDKLDVTQQVTMADLPDDELLKRAQILLQSVQAGAVKPDGSA